MWELAFLVFSRQEGKKIERCPLKFEYYLENEKHTYYPDFMIGDTIYEIKGRDYEDVGVKKEAVLKAGYKIEILRKKEINPIIKIVKTVFNVKDLSQLYDKET